MPTRGKQNAPGCRTAAVFESVRAGTRTGETKLERRVFVVGDFSALAVTCLVPLNPRSKVILKDRKVSESLGARVHWRERTNKGY